jgi:hypothetical protein
MSNQVSIEPPVLGLLASVLSPLGMLALLNELHDTLRDRAERYRDDRDPADADLFRFRLGRTYLGRLHLFHFAVNDRLAPGRLAVVEVVHTPLGPFP